MRKVYIRLAAVLALVLTLSQPLSVFADESVSSGTEENAVIEEAEEAAEAEEASEAGVTEAQGMTPDAGPAGGLTEEERKIKEDIMEHDVLKGLAGLQEGKDYAENEVICITDSEERAGYIAGLYRGRLKSYRYGVAVIDLSESDLSVYDAVALGASGDNDIPAVEPDYYSHIDEPQEAEEEARDGSLNASAGAEKSDWECVYSPKGSGGLGFDDPALNPESPDYQWMHDMVHTYGAWGYGTGSSEVTVAVIDSGVLSTHEELAGKVVGEVDLRSDDRKSEPDDPHGTHVAGIIAASAGNHKGGAGIAPGVNLISIKVESSNIPFSSLIEAFYYAAGRDIGKRRADIINISIYSPAYSGSYNEAVKYAYNRGITTVACMGNDLSNDKAYPAAFDHVIAVCALNEAGARAAYSNFGSWADISAPGSNIYSTVNGSNSAYDMMDGTSMATPVVSGACALYMSVLGHVQPDEMEEALKKNVNKVSGKGLGAGVVDAAKLMKSTGKPSSFSKGILPESTDMKEIGENLAEERAFKVAINTDAEYEARPEYKVTRAKKTGLLTSVQLFTVNVDDEKGIDEKTLILKPEITSKTGTDLSGRVKVSWSSSNTKVAEVIPSDDGSVRIRALGKGNANITCLAQDGSKKKASVKVNVIVPVSHLYIAPAKEPGVFDVMAVGKSVSFKAVAGDTYGTPSNTKVTWDYDFYLKEFDSKGNVISTFPAGNNDWLKKQKLVTVSNGKVKLAAESKWKKVDEQYYNFYIIQLKAVATDGTENESTYRIRPFPATASAGVYDFLYGDKWIKRAKKTVKAGDPGLYYDFKVFTMIKGRGSFLYEPTSDLKIESSKPDVAYARIVYDDNNRAYIWVFPVKKGSASFTFYATDGSGAKGKFSVTVK